MKRLVVSISLCALTLSASAQREIGDNHPRLSQSDFTIVERNSDGSIKSVRYAVTDNNIPANANEFFIGTLKKRSTDDFILDNSNETDYGMRFERYQQYYHGVIVDDGHYNFRFKNGGMKVVKGHYVNVTAINPKPSLTEDEAIILYASYFDIKNSNIIKSNVKLMIKEIPNIERKESKTALVYRVFLRTKDIGEGYVGYIDAHSGEFLYKEKAFFNYSTTGQFYTYYNNNNNTPKSGITEYKNNRYYLEDYTRGSGIRTLTYDLNNNPFIFYDYDNVWTQGEMYIYTMALDVHWTMEQTYDWMDYLYDHNSFDGNGAIIDSYLIEGGDYVEDAFYDIINENFNFGTAYGSSVFGPLASVDIIGHEFGHAILHKSAHLPSGQLGDPRKAIHEGLADIWGMILENHITPNANCWKTGEQIMKNGKSCLRNFQTPGDLTAHTQISSTYGYGAFNSTDPHIKGGLLPYWFYLLVNGGNGTNGANNSYQLLPVGFDLAEEFFGFTTLTSAYLEDCTTFQDMRDAFYDAALDMGYDYLAEQVQNAWYAVGLDVEPFHIYGPIGVQGSGSYYVYSPPYSIVNWSFTNIGSNPSPTLVPNSSNYSCTIYASSSFSGNLNATIYCDGKTVTYSSYITGGASPSSVGDDDLQLIPLDDTHFQISLGNEYKDAYIKAYDVTSFKVRMKDKLVNGNYVLDTSSWECGLYVIEMTNGNKKYTKKILRKKDK